MKLTRATPASQVQREVRALLSVDPSRSSSGTSVAAASVRRRSPITYLAGSAERLPVADESIDTVVSTWTLCSIPDIRAALREMRRVVKPGGRFIFIEHGRAPDARVRPWQDRLTPLWARVAGGCH